MRIGHFFIDRPRFAAVLSILLLIVGTIAYRALPVAQYPEIAPPTIVVTASYPGVTPEVIADTVATPLEQEINGVENMLYMTSSSTTDGQMSLTIVFELGTDLDTAQVLVQNRVSIAEARLPEEVRRLGVVTQKSSPDLMMVVHLLSPDESYDQLYISNYAFLQIRDVLNRIDGVGRLTVFGAREYSMRVWLDPERLAALEMTAGDVLAALRGQNVQVAGGALRAPPMPLQTAQQFTVNTQGRFADANEFRAVIVKTGEDGRITRLGDVARVELGARDYVTNSYLDNKPAVALAIFQRPGSNAIETADEIIETMEELSHQFPEGLEYTIVYNPTEFVEESVEAVYHTIFEAVALVILVIVLFLQTWRAAIIPIVAIPVSLIGTFAVMAVFGFSLNNLSLFGLVLAIGIVVDDAIVVVENIERNLEAGLEPREAARLTMDEVGAALISIALVLTAVFVPTAFLGGISGQFFRQFALTIAVATIISAFNSLTLSPALGAILLRHRAEGEKRGLWDLILGPVFKVFNAMFDALEKTYAGLIGVVTRQAVLMIVVFLGLLAGTFFMLARTPAGFIPEQDQGYLIVAVELPKGASLQRTDAVINDAVERILEVPGAAHAVSFVGFSGATFSAASNAGAIFVPMEPFAERAPGVTAQNLLGELYAALAPIQDAQLFVIMPPPVRGIGNGGGFKMMVQDRTGRGLKTLEDATWQLVGAANQAPEANQVFSTYSLSTPQYYLDIDRVRAEQLRVPIANIFEALEIYLGSSYVNDFNLFGRAYRVTAQADAPYRFDPEDIMKLRARNELGRMVPLGSVMQVRLTSGADRLVRHNLYPAAEIQGNNTRGYSSGEVIAKLETLAEDALPGGLSYDWTEIAFQQKLAGDAGNWVFPLSILLVLLVLAAQYESWALPFAIVLIVPLSILFALVGVTMRGMDNNILTQIGFVVLLGLASKNAILIVEFARQKEAEGRSVLQAACEAARLRLRPILMTSAAFILGVVPLVTASGAGAEMRQVLGTAVFSGMIGVTVIGLVLTPVLYVVVRRLVGAGGTDAP
ncbi:MAG: multidrug efflux RND transporter permease subunit [Pseudomonadota bacterium]